ncbi:MAG: hypothetical protein WC246_01220 [Candidatus Paceibacterota bacterium]|jgi:hypothetical protein
MKKLAVFMGAVTIGLFGTMTQAQSITVSAEVFSKYLGGNGAIFYDSPVVQVDTTIAWANGIYVDAWKSCGSGFGNENDLSVGWTKTLTDGCYLNVEGLYIDAHPSGDTDDNMFSPRLEFGKDFKLGATTISPYVRWENYQVQRWTSLMNGGDFLFIGTKISWQSSERLVSLSTNAKIVYDKGTFCNDSGYLAQLCARAEMKISKQTALVADVKASAPLTTHDARKNEIAVGVGIVYRF